jgi:hypothetical protein
MNLKKILILALWVTRLSAEEVVRLEYIPHSPVEQVSTLSIDLHDSLPGSKMQWTATQALTAQVTIQGKTGSIPLDLSFVLKSMKVEALANGDKIADFSNLQRVQANRLKNRPLLLTVDDASDLQIDPQVFELLKSELPALRAIPIASMLQEWFHPVFALAGKDLKLGSTYSVPTTLSGHPATFAYEIKSITDSAVMASVQGTVTSNEGNLDLNGTVTGDVLWNRENALVCQANLFYRFTGGIKIGDNVWSLNLDIKNQIESTPKK